MADHYFVRFRGKTLGPLSKEKVRELIERGQITRLHELSPDRQSWAAAESYSGLFPAAAHNSTHQGESPSSGNANATEIEPYGLSHQSRQSQTKVDHKSPITDVEAGAVWFVQIGGESRGPMDESQIITLVDQGKVDASTPVWQDGMEDWGSAGQHFPRLIRRSQNQRSNGATGSHFASENCLVDVSELAVRLTLTRKWVYFLSIAGLLFMGLAGIFGTIGFFVAVSSIRTGEASVAVVIASMIQMFFAGLGIWCFFMLLKYANSLSRLALQSNEENLLNTGRRLDWFWRSAGIVMTVALVSFMLLGFIWFLAGLRGVTLMNEL